MAIDTETLRRKLSETNDLTDEERGYLAARLPDPPAAVDAAAADAINKRKAALGIATCKIMEDSFDLDNDPAIFREPNIAGGAKLLAALIAIVALSSLLAFLEPKKPDVDAVTLWYGKYAVPVLGAIIAACGAFTYTQWRQKKELAFKLIEEFTSSAFEETRYSVIRLVRQATGDRDIEEVVLWFPAIGDRTALLHDRLLVDQTNFSGEHALQRMVYFIYRIYLYDYHGLLDRPIIRHMFHRLFSHYEILFLEFAAAFRHVRSQAPGPTTKNLYGDQWDMLPDGIEEFFRLIGFSGKLPPDHQFFYFPECIKKSYT